MEETNDCENKTEYDQSKNQLEDFQYETENEIDQLSVVENPLNFCDICKYKTRNLQYFQWDIESFHEHEILSCELCEFTTQ